jgi:hypothetical protein
MELPSAIIFINADISAITLNNLKTQLEFNEVMSDAEFDLRVSVDPNYPVLVHLNNQRILVLRQTLQDFTNRQLADVVMFVKQGMVTVLQNNYGPPTLSLPVERLNIWNLLADIKNISCKTITCRKCHCGCECNCFKHLPIQLQQMLINPFDLSGVHDANCDNEYNNPDWINRS